LNRRLSGPQNGSGPSGEEINLLLLLWFELHSFLPGEGRWGAEGVKWPGCEINQSLLSEAKGKLYGAITSLLPHIFHTATTISHLMWFPPRTFQQLKLVHET
jgi:hypothetical protein